MNLFVDVMNQSVLIDSDNTVYSIVIVNRSVLVELMVMFGDHQLSTLRTEYSITYVCSVSRFHAVVHDSNSFN